MVGAVEEERYLAIVLMLLANGADPSTRDKDGRTALDYAQRNGHERIQEILRRASVR